MACLVSLSNKLYPSGFRQELQELAKLAWPVILTQLTQVLHGPISILFCGHLGDKEKLDGAALAVSMVNVLCFSIGQGMGTACDTYFSQYFGSNNRKQMGVVLQRALFIFLLGLVVCYAIQMNLETFLRLAGQEPRIAKLAGDYMLIFLPGAFCLFIYVIMSKYIQNQNLVLPNMIIGILSVVFNAILHYVLLYVCNWGTNGAAFSMTMTYFLMLVLTMLYIFFSKTAYQETWNGFTRECFDDWGPFGYLAATGVLGSCLEWWCFEVTVILSGLLGASELGAQSVLLQFDTIWFQIPLGVGIAVRIRLGQSLGEGDANKAKTAIWVGLTAASFISGSALILCACLTRQLPYAFTNNEEVAIIASQVFPIMLIYIFFDGIGFLAKSYIIATGKQGILSIFLFITYYFISLPTGISLMFLTYLRLRGIWLGLCCGILLLAVGLFFVIVFTNWEKEVNTAQERVADGATQSIETDDVDSDKLTLVDSPGEHGNEETHRKKPQTLFQLVCRRMSVVLAFLLLLIAAVLMKIFFVLPDNYNNYIMDSMGNVTNITYIYYDNMITSMP